MEVTDLLAISIWLVLSSLVPKIGNTADATTASAAVDPDAYDPIVQIIKVGIAGFSLLLLGLSISAYRKTALKSIIYAAAAFGLFAAQLFFDYLEDAVAGWDQP